MRILDQLRKEVLERQQKEIAYAAEEQNREANYQQLILPKMQIILIYMQELVDHLNFLEKVIDVEHYDDRYPQLGLLHQTGYRITTDGFGGLSDFDRLMHITLQFTCANSGKFSYTREGKARIEQEIAFLSSRKVKFEWQYTLGIQKMPVASFTVARNIPVQFRFEVDYANSKIDLSIHNHVNFIAYRKEHTPDMFDEQFLDQIARFMLRLDNALIQLKMTPHHKLMIQKSLQEDKLQQRFAAEQRKSALATEASSSDKIMKQLLSILVPTKEE